MKKLIKKHKGFTLIELLAIIVILAIIAVITVPIILNIIDNSKKGATIDSAYGYIKAVEQYYVSKLLESNNNTLPTETKFISELPSDLNVNGQTPTDGWIDLEVGIAKSYSLKYDDYIVSYDGESDPIVEKNENYNLQACNDCVFLNDTTQRYIYNSTGSAGNTTTLSAGNYTTDYTTLTSGGNQLDFFLGHKIDENGQIKNSYVCGIKNGTLFCIEGYNPEKYRLNQKILDSIFSDCSTSTINGGVEEYRCDNSGLKVVARDNGVVSIKTEGCSVENTGRSKCAPTMPSGPNIPITD